MTNFKIKRHLEINEQFQGANITEFYYSNPNSISNDDILNDFLHSNLIENVCTRDIVKNSPHRDEFLRGAFNLSEIDSNDFKKSSKEEVKKFLADFLLEPDCHEDINDLKIIMDKYISFLDDLNADEYYIISKEWFEESNSKILTPENWVYDYYFLIIWIDKNLKILGFSEFDSD